MIKGFYTGTTGAVEHQKMMDITANNMANANTDGFKTSNIAFRDLLYQRVRMPEDYEQNMNKYDTNVLKNRGKSLNSLYNEDGEYTSPVNYFEENKLRVGMGAKVVENALVLTQGIIKSTGSSMTVALTNPRALMAVRNQDGEVAYTRSGSFTVSEEEDGAYLCDANGDYVLDDSYERILLPDGINTSDLKFVPHSYGGGDESYVKIGIYSANNISGLYNIGSNKYITSNNSGEVWLADNVADDVIRQFNIEASNVNIAEEMVKVIQAQRAFQSNLTVIKTADEIESYANQLRGQ